MINIFKIRYLDKDLKISLFTKCYICPLPKSEKGKLPKQFAFKNFGFKEELA